MEKEPITVSGLKSLKSELENLKNVQRPKIVAAIAEARSHGDLKENAEYHAAKEQQSLIESRVITINDLIARANVIDVTKIENNGKVIFGSTVKVQDLNADKKIPVFSGLGGGTSNAASVFKSLIRKKVEKKIFNEIVNYVGSDFRLFFYKLGFLKDLNKVMKLNKKYKLYFLIVFPNIKNSTKEVYSRLKRFSLLKPFVQKKIKSKDIFINTLKRNKNDLQLTVENKYPVIRKLLNSIEIEKGCYFSRMTGSGSACYGLFMSEHCSKAALNSLRKKYPKFWFSIAKTI